MPPAKKATKRKAAKKAPAKRKAARGRRRLSARQPRSGRPRRRRRRRGRPSARPRRRLRPSARQPSARQQAQGGQEGPGQEAPQGSEEGPGQEEGARQAPPQGSEEGSGQECSEAYDAQAYDEASREEGLSPLRQAAVEKGPGQPGPFFTFANSSRLEIVEARERFGRRADPRADPAARAIVVARLANDSACGLGPRRCPSSSAIDSDARAARRPCRRRGRVDPFDVIDAAGLEQQQRVRAGAARRPAPGRSAGRVPRRCRRPSSMPGVR